LKSVRKYDKIAAEYNMYMKCDRRVPISNVSLAPVPISLRGSCLNSEIKIEQFKMQMMMIAFKNQKQFQYLFDKLKHKLKRILHRVSLEY